MLFQDVDLVDAGLLFMTPAHVRGEPARVQLSPGSVGSCGRSWLWSPGRGQTEPTGRSREKGWFQKGSFPPLVGFGHQG